MSGVNRYFQRKRYAQFEPLSMQEMAFPYEKQEQRQREMDDLALKATAMDVKLDSLPWDNAAWKDKVNNLYNKSSELGSSLTSGMMNPREGREAFRQLFQERNKLQQELGVPLAQRKEIYTSKLKEIEDADINEITKNRLRAELAKTFEENPLDLNKGTLAGITMPNWTASYDAPTTTKEIADVVGKLKASTTIAPGSVEALGKANSYTDVFKILSQEGVSPDRILGSISPYIDTKLDKAGNIVSMDLNTNLQNSIAQDWLDFGGEEGTGKTLNDYLSTEANRLMESALSQAFVDTNVDFKFLENEVDKENSLALNNSGDIGDNLTLEVISSTAFEGRPSITTNQSRIESLNKSIADLKNEISTGNYSEGQLANKQSTLASLERQLDMANKMKEKIKPVHEKIIKNLNDEEQELYDYYGDLENFNVRKLEDYTKENLDKYRNKYGTYLAQYKGVDVNDLNIAELYAAKPFFDAVVDRMEGNVPDRVKRPLDDAMKLAENDIGGLSGSKWADTGAKVSALFEKVDNLVDKDLDYLKSISRPVYSATGKPLPGYTPKASELFWKNTVPNYFGNIGNWMDAKLVIEGQLGESQTLQSYLTNNDISPASDEYKAIQKAIGDASNSVKLGQHGTLTNEGIWNVSIVVSDKDGNPKAVDLALSTTNINNPGIKAIQNTPMWKFESMASTAAASGLDEFNEPLLKQYGDWTWKFNSRSGIDGVNIEGKDYTFAEAADMYNTLTAYEMNYEFDPISDLPTLINKYGSIEAAVKQMKKEL